jgi:hypothetical protein
VIIIVCGDIGRFPVGGEAWLNMQYLAGLQALGHDVYYLEECGEEAWVYNWDTFESTTDIKYQARYVRECLQAIDFPPKWIYRMGNQSEGMSLEDFQEVCCRADLMLIRGLPLPLWRAEYKLPRRRIFIDEEPGFTQLALLNGHGPLLETAARCERLFTVGQRMGGSDCSIPTANHTWLRTVHPVYLGDWPIVETHNPTHFTTVLQWRAYRETHVNHNASYGDLRYGQKDEEFAKFQDLPRLTKQGLRMALIGGSPEMMAGFGWETISGWDASRTPASYRAFIVTSRAEFSVQKHGYVVSRGGWFSDRSTCYLASGKPVLVQDTGLHDWLPTGEGVLSFCNVSEALAGIESINEDYDRHCRRARTIAEEYFSTDVVLPALIEAAMS